MKIYPLIISTFFVAFLVSECSLFPSKVFETTFDSNGSVIQAPITDSKAEFGGVSFEFDPALLGTVEAKEVPESRLQNPDDRPDEVAPRHVEFIFSNGPPGWNGSLAVYPVKEFPAMYSINKQSMRSKEKEIEGLRKVIQDKNFRVTGEIPYLPFIDAGQSFQVKVNLSRFSQGKGIFFATYLSTEMALISNDHLRYIFEGLTDDGDYYILAEIPIAVDFLPDESPEKFEGYEERFLYEDFSSQGKIKKRHKIYLESITSRMEALPPDRYRPQLSSLDKIISSLKIDKVIKH